MSTLANKKGFTLVEIIVVMAILSMIVVVVADFQVRVFTYNKIFMGGNFVGTDALNVVKSMATELRSMSPSSGGAYPIESVGTSSVVFFVDTDNDGIKERVRYFLSGTSVRRGIIKPAGNPLAYSTSTENLTTLMANVRNTASSTLFTYYNTYYDGSATTSLPYPVAVSSVRMIVINAILDADPTRPFVPLYATTQVSLRNLKDNL